MENEKECKVYEEKGGFIQFLRLFENRVSVSCRVSANLGTDSTLRERGIAAPFHRCGRIFRNGAEYYCDIPPAEWSEEKWNSLVQIWKEAIQKRNSAMAEELKKLSPKGWSVLNAFRKEGRIISILEAEAIAQECDKGNFVTSFARVSRRLEWVWEKKWQRK